MNDLLSVPAVLLLYPAFVAAGTRLQLGLRPALREKPGQGVFTRSAAAGFGVLFLIGLWLTGPDPSLPERAAHLGLLLGCEALVLVSLFCVSESGRRFYLMSLIDRERELRLSSLKDHYGRREMLNRRLDRLTTWHVLARKDQRWFLRRQSAWWYSLFFYGWGRLLGYKWFDR
ncbi:MAG: hypothetical protein GVY10_11620 [Verrucomicrobia bacterium]|jgi:hypothetical protein|nr:hypothetical protein [Verrucomicrobiota bacterium]